MPGPLRCFQCGRTYREEQNHDSACAYHTGHLLDFDRLGQPGLGLAQDFWDCCHAVIEDDKNPMATTCATGRHVEAPPDDPGPIERPLRAKEEIVRQVLADMARKHPWVSPERVEMARRRVRRFLKGRVDFPGYDRHEEEGLPHDVRILEKADFAWLLAEAQGAAACPVEQRRLLAASLNDPQKAEQLRHAAGIE